MASLVTKWTIHRDTSLDIWKHFLHWLVFSTKLDTQITLDSPNAWLLKSSSDVWFTLFSLCLSASKEKDIYGLMFALGIVSYRSILDIPAIHALRSIAAMGPSRLLLQEEFLRLANKNFNLSLGHTLDSKEIQNIAEQHRVPFMHSPQSELTRRNGETMRSAATRREEAYRLECEKQCQQVAVFLFDQWPSSLVEMPNDFADTYSLINAPPFKREISRLISAKFLNRRLYEHTERLKYVFNTIPDHQPVVASPMLTMAPEAPAVGIPHPTYAPLTLLDLVRSNDRLASAHPYSRATTIAQCDVSSIFRLASSRSSSTRGLILELSKQSSGGIATRYVKDLKRCVDALELQVKQPLKDIRSALWPQTVPERVLLLAGLWPCLGTACLLSLLSQMTGRWL